MEDVFPILFTLLGAVAVTLLFDRLALFKHQSVTFDSPQRQSLLALSLATFVVLAIALYVAFFRAQKADAPYDLSRMVRQLVISGWILLPFIIALIASRQSLATMGISRHNIGSSTLLGILISVAVVIIVGKAAMIIRGLSPSDLYHLVGYLGVGFSEEAIFRGYIQLRLQAWLGDRQGWILTAIVFALYHIPQRIFVDGFSWLEMIGSMIPLFVVGLLFGWIMRKCENIIAPALFHTFLNWVQV